MQFIEQIDVVYDSCRKLSQRNNAEIVGLACDAIARRRAPGEGLRELDAEGMRELDGALREVFGVVRDDSRAVCEPLLRAALASMLRITTAFDNRKLRASILNMSRAHAEAVVDILNDKLLELMMVLNLIPTNVKMYRNALLGRALDELSTILGVVLADLCGDIYD